VRIAISNEAKCEIDPVDVGGREGYVQAVDITVNKRRIRVVNVYDQKMTGSNRKPAEESNWARLLGGRCIVAGDMNAYGRVWNARAGQAPGNARFWERTVEDFECRVGTRRRRPGGASNASNHSIIDLTLPTGDIELNWFSTGDAHHTGSDHADIGWEILGLGSVDTVETVTGWDVSGWSTAGVYEKEEKEKWAKA